MAKFLNDILAPKSRPEKKKYKHKRYPVGGFDYGRKKKESFFQIAPSKEPFIQPPSGAGPTFRQTIYEGPHIQQRVNKFSGQQPQQREGGLKVSRIIEGSKVVGQRLGVIGKGISERLIGSKTLPSGEQLPEHMRYKGGEIIDYSKKPIGEQTGWYNPETGETIELPEKIEYEPSDITKKHLEREKTRKFGVSKEIGQF